MFRLHLALLVVFSALVWLAADTAAAQQTTIGTPFRGIGDNFYENIGSNWSLRGPGWFFNFGGPSVTAPQFGGFDPNNQAQLGFAVGHNTIRGGINIYG